MDKIDDSYIRNNLEIYKLLHNGVKIYIFIEI